MLREEMDLDGRRSRIWSFCVVRCFHLTIKPRSISTPDPDRIAACKDSALRQVDLFRLRR